MIQYCYLFHGKLDHRGAYPGDRNGRVIRPVIEELIFRGALRQLTKGWKLYAEIWLPALSSTVAYIFLHNPFR